MNLLPLVCLALLFLASLAVVAGPVSRFVAAYVDSGEREDGEEPFVVRRRRLLSPVALSAVAGLLCALTAAWGAWRGAWEESFVAVPVVAVLSAASCVDAACHRLPNRLLAAAAAWVAAAAAVAALVGLIAGEGMGQAAWPLGRALLCAVAAGALVLLGALARSGLGMGDVKLSAVLGLWLGLLGHVWVVAAVVTGFVLAGLVAIVLMVARLVGRKEHIALGPYLAAGGWLAWLMAVV